MYNFEFSSIDYNVFPVKVHDSTMPWIEICEKIIDNNCNCIVIDPVIGSDPLDIRESLPIFKTDDSTEPNQIYGSYIANNVTRLCDTETHDAVTPIIMKVSIACLKESSILKHVQGSSLIAMTNMFKQFKMYDESTSSNTPYIILNTKCDANLAPLNTFSEMVREITIAYLNCYDVYPTIFVAFSDDMLLTSDNICNKPKKKKKKNKKK